MVKELREGCYSWGVERKGRVMEGEFGEVVGVILRRFCRSC